MHPGQPICISLVTSGRMSYGPTGRTLIGYIWARLLRTRACSPGNRAGLGPLLEFFSGRTWKHALDLCARGIVGFQLRFVHGLFYASKENVLFFVVIIVSDVYDVGG